MVSLGTIAERTIGPAVVRAADAIRSATRGRPSVHVRGSDTRRRHRGHERGWRRAVTRRGHGRRGGARVPGPLTGAAYDALGGELMSRRTVGIVLAAIGVVGIAGSVVWEHVAEPKLVKYPTDVDESPEYEGTVKIFLDPKTYQPLDPALEAPLHVVRHIKALGNESTDSKVVLSEKIDLTAEGQFTGELDAQYVMDRTTINNVPDDRAWAFTPDNVVDRSPAFRLAFPFDTKAEPTLIYKNEIATTYMAQPAGEGEAAGLHVINFTGEQATPVPASPAYIAAISKFNPLPSELTLDQLKPVLKAKGLDVDALLPQLLPNLTPDDTNTLLGARRGADQAPVPVQLLRRGLRWNPRPGASSRCTTSSRRSTSRRTRPSCPSCGRSWPGTRTCPPRCRASPRSTSWPPSRSWSSRTRSRRPTHRSPTWRRRSRTPRS